MPLLYGEGRRSFHRLQEEILKTSEDYTLFAWLGCASNGTDVGLLSPSADSFAPGPLNSAIGPENYSASALHVEKFIHKQSWGSPLPAAQLGNTHDYDPPRLTSRGLRITLALLDGYAKTGSCIVYLNCKMYGKWPVCVPLRPVRTNGTDFIFTRISQHDRHDDWQPFALRTINLEKFSAFKMHTIYVKEQPFENTISPSLLSRDISLELIFPTTRNSAYATTVLETQGARKWKHQYTIRKPESVSLLLQVGDYDVFIVRVACAGFAQRRGCCKVVTHNSIKNLPQLREMFFGMNSMMTKSTKAGLIVS